MEGQSITAPHTFPLPSPQALFLQENSPPWAAGRIPAPLWPSMGGMGTTYITEVSICWLTTHTPEVSTEVALQKLRGREGGMISCVSDYPGSTPVD